MQQPDFFLGYLPFWIMTYALSAVAWTCLGRCLLGFFVRPDSANYIWRGFRFLTDWAVAAVAVITPRAVPTPFLVPIAAVWVFFLRGVLSIVLYTAGMVPTIAPAAAGAG